MFLNKRHPLPMQMPMARLSRRWNAVLDDPAPPGPGVHRLVPLAPAVLGATMAFLALGRLAADQGSAGVTLAVATGTAGAALVLCSLIWRRHDLGSTALHAVLAGCVLLGAADTVAYTQSTARPDRAAELILLAAGCGLLLIPGAWYLGALSAVLAAWISLAWAGGPAQGLYLLGAAVSLGLSHGVRQARLTSLRESAEELQRASARQPAPIASTPPTAHGTGHTIRLDPRTGLPDQGGVLLVGEHLHAIARREKSAIGCAIVEIGGYQEVQATWGQAAADALVRHLATVLSGAVRQTDVVGRWAPDQFAVVAHGQGASTEILTRRIAQTLEQDCPLDATQWPRVLRLGHALREPWEEEGLRATLDVAAAGIGGPLLLDLGPHPERDEPEQGEQGPDGVHRPHPVAGSDHRHLQQAAEQIPGA